VIVGPNEEDIDLLGFLISLSFRPHELYLSGLFATMGSVLQSTVWMIT